MIYETVLWLDTGNMTGFAMLDRHGRDFWADEFDFQTAAVCLENLCASRGPRLAVGYERYVVDPRRPQTHVYDALGMTGVTRYLARKYRCIGLPPSQAHTPTKAEHQILAAIGWWPRGRNDAQAAAWHLYGWCQRTHNLPPRERAILLEGVSTMGGRS
jgi:hypothetical protein